MRGIGRPGRPLAFAPFLLAFLLVVPLGFPLHAEPAGADGPRLTGGSFLPYRFCHARLEDASGMLGEVRVTGIGWSGSRQVLFAGRAEAWTASFEIAFYVDEDLRSLAVEAETPGGKAFLALDLAELALGEEAPSETELARRTALRDLPLPLAQPRQGSLPSAFPLKASSLADAASQSAASCLVAAPPLASLSVLAAFIALAALLEAARDRMGRKLARAFAMGLAVLATSAALLLAPRQPRLVLVELPRPATAKATGEPVIARYDAELRLAKAPDGAVEIMRYSASSPGGPSFLAMYTPGTQGIPLGLLERERGGVVFSRPPLVVARQGGLELRFDGWATGWMAGDAE